MGAHVTGLKQVEGRMPKRAMTQLIRIDRPILEQFSRVIYVDADMLVLRNIDELFDSEPLSATSEINPPILFNR